MSPFQAVMILSSRCGRGRFCAHLEQGGAAVAHRFVDIQLALPEMLRRLGKALRAR